jgi:mannose-1-phosphate guanylyltransferase
MALHAVVLAGGSGTRFWPLSTRGRPKHLLALLGKRTLLEETVARLRGLVPPSRTVVVTARDQAPEVRRLLRRLPRGAVIAEPRPRNTAAAIALAAARIAARDPDAVLVVVSADHWIPDGAAFRRTMAVAAARARKARSLVLVGVGPDRPATGYGYLRVGRRVGRVRGAPVRDVAQFTEKPDLATARRWLRARTHLWNAGLFAWRADVFLDELRLRLPALHRALVASGAATGGAAALRRAYDRSPSISVDYGVLERSDRVECVLAGFRWDDLGSFAALLRHLPRDRRGNAAQGGTLLAVNARGVLSVAPPGHATAVLGLDRIAVVTTPEATLVLPLDRCEEVREIVEALRQRPA